MNTIRRNANARKAEEAIIEERRKRVAANLLGGMTYREIAAALKVSLGTVARDAKEILKRLKSESVIDFAEAKMLSARRLDVATNAIWNMVTAGHITYIDVLVKLEKRRAALLGLDAPTKLAGYDGGAIKIEQPPLVEAERVARLLELMSRTPGEPLPPEDAENGAGG